MRPISLCNVSNKILSKTLCNRLSRILSKVISPEQSSFIKGRMIQDNLLLALELCHHLNKKDRGFNVMIKLDMQKAYVSLNKFALIKVMRETRFSNGGMI